MREVRSAEGGEAAWERMTFGQWLENAWYHYKWHILITLFFTLFIGVCVMQTCQKASYDVSILYGGGEEIVRTSDNGTEPPYEQMKHALLPYVGDADGDGEVTLSYQTLYLLTNEQIHAINEARRAEAALTGEAYEEVNAAYVKENLTVLNSELRYGDYYICILSEQMYRTHRTTSDGVSLFAPLSSYVTDPAVQLVAEDAVLLSSTELGRTGPFADLPDGTVICLRTLSEFSARRSRARAQFAASEAVLRRMLAPHS